MALEIKRYGRGWPALAALLCSATLFFFGTGLSPVAVLTWLAPIPVPVLASRSRGWPAFGVAFAAALLGTSNVWILQTHSGDEPLWPFGILMDVSMSLFFALAVWVFWALLRRGRALLATLAGPAVWTTLIYLVVLISPMGMMGTFATDQADLPVVLQVSSLTGFWGVEFLVLLPAFAIGALCAPGVARAAKTRAVVVAAVALVLALGGGIMRMGSEQGTPQRVAAITQNAGYQWGPELGKPEGRDVVAGYIKQIEALPDGVRTIVLPEAAFSAEEEWPAAMIDPMRQAAKAKGAAIVVGFEWYDRKGKHNYDTALGFPADGGLPARYLKHHDLSSPPNNDLAFVPGTDPKTAMQICGDFNFPNPSRDSAVAGSRILANPGELAAPPEDRAGWQHSRNAMLRGVENGQAIVMSDANGMSMISDGYGRVLAAADTGGPDPFLTITAEVPAGPGATGYSHAGDWFAWLCVALTLAGLVFAHPKTSRRERRTGSVQQGPNHPNRTAQTGARVPADLTRPSS